MVVVVEKEDGSDVEQQLPAKAPPPSWPPPKLQGLPAGLRALIERSDPSGTGGLVLGAMAGTARRM